MIREASVGQGGLGFRDASPKVASRILFAQLQLAPILFGFTTLCRHAILGQPSSPAFPGVIHMRYPLSDLIDIQPISKLFDYLHKATGIRCDIFALTGTPLTSWSSWESLCVDFHRAHPETGRMCVESDTSVVNHLLNDREYAIYTCKNGMTDAAARVMVGGEHVANVLCGQLFCRKPDLEFFRKQALRYGFDEDSYLRAVLKVPVVSKTRLETLLRFVSHLAGLLGDLGLRHLKQLEAEDALRTSESKYRNIFENAVEGIFQAGPNGRYVHVNPAMARMHGYGSPEEMLEDAPFMAAQLFTDPEERKLFFSLLRTQDVVKAFESQVNTVDGRKIWVSVNARILNGEKADTMYEGTVESITDRKQAETGMIMAQQRLEALSRTLLKKMEVERHHIAHELHDEIGQALTAVKMSLQSLRPDDEAADNKARIEGAIAIIDRSLVEVRRLSVNLRPAVLDDLGLVAALRWLVGSMLTKNGLEIHFHADDGVDKDLSKGMATACFRVAQEAITNVIRHARASLMMIRLVRDGDELKLTVHDDGIGFDVKLAQTRATHGESFGLLAMRERVVLSGGTLFVESNEGEGCKITAYFPLKREQVTDGTYPDC
jgi:PAS domain S-box-containing protein